MRRRQINQLKQAGLLPPGSVVLQIPAWQRERMAQSSPSSVPAPGIVVSIPKTSAPDPPAVLVSARIVPSASPADKMAMPPAVKNQCPYCGEVFPLLFRTHMAICPDRPPDATAAGG